MGKSQKPLKLLVDTYHMTTETIQFFVELKAQGHTIWFIEEFINANADQRAEMVTAPEGIISIRAWGLPEIYNKTVNNLIIKSIRDRVYGSTKETT